MTWKVTMKAQMKTVDELSDFRRNLSWAKGTEAAVRTYFEDVEGRSVRDVSGHWHYQRLDIDFIVDRLGAVEVKADQHQTGNIFIEVRKRTLDGTVIPGCVFKSRASYWAYLFVKDGVLALIDLPKLQQWAKDHAADYVWIRRRNRGRFDNEYWVEGYAAPLLDITTGGVSVTVRDLPPDLTRGIGELQHDGYKLSGPQRRGRTKRAA